MGYTLTIGNAALRYDADDLYLCIEAEGATHPDAPDHDKFTGKGNSLSPSYTVWSDFCRDAGIYELFYGQGWSREERRYLECSEDFHRETPLLAHHPGYAPICRADLDFVKAARERREQSNGERPPGFFDYGAETDWKEVDNGTDPVLARLVWLEFWLEWALGNCAIPIIENS